MRLRRSLIFAIVGFGLFGLSGCGAGSSAGGRDAQSEDPRARDRRSDPSEALGFYTNGSLANGVSLPPESEGHLKIFRPRNRGWATKSLVRSILESTSALRRRFPEGDRAQVGDMSSEFGGILSLHDSHQNGLDVDIAYLRANHVERDPEDVGEQGFDESFVRNKKVTRNFDMKRNWFLMKELVQRGNAARIFVDPEIKRALCAKAEKLDPKESAAARTEVLRRLRPYPNHDDHLHFRIPCPENSPKCLAQIDPPEGSGCDRIDEVPGFSEQDEHSGSR